MADFLRGWHVSANMREAPWRTVILIALGMLNVLILYGRAWLPGEVHLLVLALLPCAFGFVAGDYPLFGLLVLLGCPVFGVWMAAPAPWHGSVDGILVIPIDWLLIKLGAYFGRLADRNKVKVSPYAR